MKRIKTYKPEQNWVSLAKEHAQPIMLSLFIIVASVAMLAFLTSEPTVPATTNNQANGTQPTVVPATPVPTPSPSPLPPNPLKNRTFHILSESQPQIFSDRLLAAGNPEAALIEQIADKPFGKWINAGFSREDMQELILESQEANEVPIIVVYEIRNVSCSVDVERIGAFNGWINEISLGIGDGKALVVIEPDALPLLDNCDTPEGRQMHMEMLYFATKTLGALPNAVTYLDAGHSAWYNDDNVFDKTSGLWRPGIEVMAERLNKAGINNIRGFSLNVSNYQTNQDSVVYGERLSELVGDKHFVIDSSRNGLGSPADREWCNAFGRALGVTSATTTTSPLADGYHWIKVPGESDGSCNGGTSEGTWWQEYAVGLVGRSDFNTTN